VKSNCTWKAGLFIALVTIGVLHAAPTETEHGSKAVKLFARESSITVGGGTVELTALTQSNGEQGYSPLEAEGFHLEVVNQLSVLRRSIGMA
jgi:hypothetical protein